MSLTIQAMLDILSDIGYKDWNFNLKADKGGRPYLQILWKGIDVENGKETLMASRKWWLSPHMCKSEFVRTVFKAVEAVERHEMEELFRYRGRAIFNPHTDVDALAEACGVLDVRKELNGR